MTDIIDQNPILQEYETEKEKMRNFKVQMQEIFAILDKQKEDLKKKEMQTLEQSIKQASKEKEFKTLSFNSVIARPPFIMAPQKKDYFDPKLPRTFIDTGKVLDYSEREALIFPSRIKEKNISNIYASCMENSSVPKIIPKRNLSHKEMDYKQKWDENFKKLREQELYYLRQKDDGVLKSKIMKDLLTKSKVFKPNKYKLDYFQKNPSLLSDYPDTRSEIERKITLERNFEKKYWRPNRKILDLFEKPKNTY